MAATDSTGRGGYKHPPAAHQFKPGKSGNPKGRPKGTQNYADLVKSALERKCKVTIGGKPQKMLSSKAILHALATESARGSSAARKALDRLIDMTGQSKQITDEAYEQHTLRLPDSFTNEEFDFLTAPARERERQWCERQADFEDGSYSNSTAALAIQAGDNLVMDGRSAEAIQRYTQALTSCKTEMGFDPKNQTFQAEFRRAVSRIGLIADGYLHTGDFDRAFELASLALTESSSEFWIAPPEGPYGRPKTNITWIRAIRAHACTMLGQIEEANKFYRSFSSKRNAAETSWETSILRDFVRLRKAGHSHELMNEIESFLSDQGWDLSVLNRKVVPPQLDGEDVVFVEMHPDDVKAGDLLLSVGKPQEAIEVYLKALEKWVSNLNRQPDRKDWQDKVAEVARRLANAILLQFKAARFFSSLEYVERAIAIAPRVPLLRLVHACALMLHGRRDDDARHVFLAHRGSSFPDASWDDAVVAKFRELREIGCGRPLMNEIEALFATSAAPSVCDETSAPTTVAWEGDIDPPVEPPRRHPNVLPEDVSGIKSGDELFVDGRLDDALTVYLRRLRICDSIIASGRSNIQAIEDRGVLAGRISDLAMAFVLQGEFQKALRAIESYPAPGSETPLPPLLDIRRAHALMLLDRLEESKSIYLMHRGAKVDADRSAQFLIAQDFEALKADGTSHPLMAELLPAN